VGKLAGRLKRVLPPMQYWAHSDRFGLPLTHPEARWQPLAEHLANVSILSRAIAKFTSPNDTQFQKLAACGGLLHDFGKYSDRFQRMIISGEGRCQHAIHGASFLQFGDFPGAEGPRPVHLALAIAGHHAGLTDIVGGESSLQSRIKKHQADALDLVERAKQDSELLNSMMEQPLPAFDRIPALRFDLYTRMLFSCLVDADRLDSAGRPLLQQPLEPALKLETLLRQTDELAKKMPDGAVKSARKQVLEDCLAAGTLSQTLLSLSVPTGGGKTLASLAFALKRAALNPEQYRRIIVVIPYLSIIEQNAEVYGRVFGRDAILEHHSGACERLVSKDSENFTLAVGDDNGENAAERYRNETENWDAPLIVTTSVRFFESLFSNRPSDLRRVHNITRSIVILDEVQTLPRRLLSPLLTIIRELSEDWGCTFVFSTATQPAFQRSAESPKDSRLAPGSMKEIVQRPDALRSSLKRVNVDWRINEPIGWPEVARQMLSQSQALCIVNVRDHANELFDEAMRQAKADALNTEGLFHLSTRMCAEHRLAVLARVHSRLSQHLPCWLVSTQLVEAGVDVDFPLVLRALGPLDSIFQAAGRADREGRLTAEFGYPGGRVVVFLPEDPRVPPNEYKLATELTATLAREALARGKGPQVDSMEAIHSFFERYYGEGADLGEKLQTMRERAEFAKLANDFEMINSRTRDVFVPYGEEALQWLDELRTIGFLTAELRKKLQRNVVGLQPYEFDKARGVLAELRQGSEIWIAVEGSYSDTKGLKFQLEDEDLLFD
jgi:CRISPR-associated endonuclease/helicase Cas3